jgi:hypothetical protein
LRLLRRSLGVGRPGAEVFPIVDVCKASLFMVRASSFQQHRGEKGWTGERKRGDEEDDAQKKQEKQGSAHLCRTHLRTVL